MTPAELAPDRLRFRDLFTAVFADVPVRVNRLVLHFAGSDQITTGTFL